MRDWPENTGMLFGMATAFVGLFLLGISFELYWLRLIVKAAPLLCLLVWLLTNFKSEGYMIFVANGLIFSLLGDVVLEASPALFIPGLLLFLIAHIFYIWAYLKHDSELRIVRGMPMLVYGIGVTGLLVSGGKMKVGMMIPVMIYTSVICVMLWRVSCRLSATSVSRFSAHVAFWGAILFALSDTLIAINKFYVPVPYVRYGISVLYWMGQFGIALSVVGAARREWAPVAT